MQELISIAVCHVLPKNMRMVVIHLYNFYRIICAKRLLKKDIKKMKAMVAIILCDLEKIFSPSFFIIMMHLTIYFVGGGLHLEVQCSANGCTPLRGIFKN